jgi:LmbE family N-acetylglucosaminyl deacetylase
MKRFVFFLFSVAALASGTATARNAGSSPKQAEAGVRVLLVVAHPDDEYEMAGTVYRISKELSGSVDQLIITNGEAGYHYSSLADRYYGVNLTDESVGRARLPRIRREEARRAGRILGIRHQWFLNEKNDHFTIDADEVLNRTWHTERVLANIQQRLRKGHYDFVFVLLPADETHGEHKAASILTLKAVEQLPAHQRPVVLGAQAGANQSETFHTLPGYSLTATNTAGPQFQFDRDIRLGYRESLSYQIVVGWVIAEHKSQGLFQTRCRQDRFENFWLFTMNRESASNETVLLFATISARPETGEATGIANVTKLQ